MQNAATPLSYRIDMSEQEIGLVILTLTLFLGVVHALGYIFERLRQPRLVGEIIAGILLGPFVLGQLSPSISDYLFHNAGLPGGKMETVFGYLYWLGVLLLMFLSGSQVRRLLSEENRRPTAWILGVGAPLPFVVVLLLGLTSWIPLESLTGTKGAPTATLLILAIAAAVTSIPVISRIFHDLGILHTRFASLVLGAAVLEDIGLWGIVAVAAALAQQSDFAGQGLLSETIVHVAISAAYMAAGIIVLPQGLKHVRGLRWNLIYKASPLAYALLVLFVYVGGAALLNVNLVFSAFLAGFGLTGGIKGEERLHFADPLDAIGKFSFGFFIPIYFGMVGYRLMLGRDFSLAMLLAFLVGSSVLTIASRHLASRLAGFRNFDAWNIAVTSNARGGPGIVLASVAFDAGIISGALYTTMVLTAILTSQAAGMWLRFVLASGQPLLTTNPEDYVQIAPTLTPSPCNAAVHAL